MALNTSHIQLFAKLSKILAETFQDIHTICLRELREESRNGSSGNDAIIGEAKRSQGKNGSGGVGERVSITKQQWLQKREQQKYRDDELQAADLSLQHEQHQEQPKPPKTKKIKSKPVQNGNDSDPKQKKHEKKKKVAKWQLEGKPRPPLNAFMLFLKDSKMQIMDAKPELTPSEVSSYASALWNQLTEDQKQKYKIEYRQNRTKYYKQLKQFQDRQKLSGKVAPVVAKNSSSTPKKPMEKTQKVVKDILDQEIVNEQISSDSESLSGI